MYDRTRITFDLTVLDNDKMRLKLNDFLPGLYKIKQEKLSMIDDFASKNGLHHIFIFC